MQNTSIKKNFVMNIILTMSSFIFPIISFPYVSRVLLPTGTGKVSFAVSVISYFNMFAQLGIPTYGIRACAKARENKEELTRITHELLFINLCMGLLSYFALALAICIVPRLSHEKGLLVVVSSAIFLDAIGIEWLYKGLEQYSYITKRSLVFKILAIIGMFLLIHEEKDYLIYGGITIFSSSLPGILNFFHAKKYIDLKPIGGYNVKRHLRFVFVFFAMACATTIYTNLDAVMLGFIKTDADVGYYNAAVKIKRIIVSIVTALGAVLLPRASYYIEQGLLDEFKKVSGKALKFVFLAASPLALFFIIYAREGIYFLSGAEFEGSILPMQIIMPTVFFIGITNILGIQMLVPLGKEKVVLKSEIAGAVIDFALNMLLIGKLGASGAAIGTLVAEVIVFLVQYHALRNEVKDIFAEYAWWRLVFALVLAVTVSSWVKLLNLRPFLSLALSGLMFFGTYGVFLFFQKEELLTSIWIQINNKLNHKT